MLALAGIAAMFCRCRDDPAAAGLHPQRVEKNIRRPCRGKLSLSELGWPNLLLRDKLPTGNEQGSAGISSQEPSFTGAAQNRCS